MEEPNERAPARGAGLVALALAVRVAAELRLHRRLGDEFALVVRPRANGRLVERPSPLDALTVCLVARHRLSGREHPIATWEDWLALIGRYPPPGAGAQG